MSCSIIGISIKLPKGLGKEGFWKALLKEKSFVDGMSDSRREFHSGQQSKSWGDLSKVKGMYFDDIDCFDKNLFNLSTPALMFTDPRQRLLMESCWGAIEDAGWRLSALKEHRVGVFLGQDSFDMSAYYQNIPTSELSAQEFIIPGTVSSFLASRISSVFDLKGPSIVVDSTCSSIYVAIDHARSALEKGECDFALVGGATLLVEPWKSGEIKPTSFESGADNIKSFSNDAQGYCSSEGCGAMLLQKSHSDNTKEQDSYGIIVSSGYNSGGKTRSFAQPDQAQQEQLFRSVLKEGNVRPEEIDYIESHGVGSPLGDAIEANALINVFDREGQDDNPCYISTIKPNIGHPQAASGLYSLLKVLLSMKYGSILGIKGFNPLNINKDISKEIHRVVFLTAAKEWSNTKNKGRKSAFLTSYGANNVNAALLIKAPEPYVHSAPQSLPSKKVLICLSAETPEQLEQQRIRLSTFLNQEQNSNASLLELAYTLQIGREALRHRFAVEVSTLTQLKKALMTKKESDNGVAFWGDEKKPQKDVSALLEDKAGLDKHLVTSFEKGQWPELAMLWVNGINIKWHFCYGGIQLKKMHLPIYPFAKGKYWIPKSKKVKQSNTIGNKLHPLVHRNTSTLKYQKFSSTYVGTESFLVGHQVNGTKCLAGEAHLELARAAGENSLDNKVTQVKDVSWLNLIKVPDEEKEAHIRLLPTHNEEEFAYEIYSYPEEGKELLHSQGKLGTTVLSTPADIDLQGIRNRLTQYWDTERLYKVFTENGLTFGDNYKGLISYFFSEEECLGEIVLPEPEEEGYIVSPGIVDNALQAAVGWPLALGKEDTLNLPFSLKEVNAYREMPTTSTRMWTYIKKSKNNRENSINTKHDIDLVNDEGRVFMSFKEFVFRNLNDRQERENDKLQAQKQVKNSLGHSALEAGDTISELGDTGENTLKRKTADYFKGLLSKELQLTKEELELNVPFEKYGIDSFMVNRLTNVLEGVFGRLDRTLFFEYLTLNELVDYFIQEHSEKLLGLSHTSTDAQPQQKEKLMRHNEGRPRFSSLEDRIPLPIDKGIKDNSPDSVAIIGLSGRYPGATDIHEFWENLRQGRDSITEIPRDRWEIKDFYTSEKEIMGKSYSKWGGFMEGIDKFDPLFFNISPNEAQLMDPQERLFIQTVWEAIEDAGYTSARLQGKKENKEKSADKVGVYAGVMFQDYSLLGVQQFENGDPLPDGIDGNIANRVSYFFDFQGPSITLDTMCSSSLTAIHMACQGLLTGDAQVAIAGGVNICTHPYKYLMLCQKQFLSSRGRCESFGKEGNGYVPAEGVGAIVLKPLRRALAEGDHIYGVIKGTSINHGGKTNGYTVPNPNAQSATIREAIEKARVRPEDFSYIEAHGTGTSLGDPIEIKGLTKAFLSENKQYCSIGSVKSNIGHAESAAGIAGVTKVLLQLQHRTLVPSLHASQLNPHIDFEKTPFKVQQVSEEWTNKGGQPRLAGISSFGAGGSNAHIIIEEHIVPELGLGQKPQTEHTPVIIVLSARNKEQLQKQVQNLKKYVDASKNLNLPDIAYTLQIGREAMDERLAFTVKDNDSLVRTLKNYLKGDNKGILSNNVKGIKTDSVEGTWRDEEVARAIENKNSASLLSFWVQGRDIDWRQLYPQNAPKRISLPTYPFEQKRCWLPKIQSSQEKSENQHSELTAGEPGNAMTHQGDKGIEKEGKESVRFTPHWKTERLVKIPNKPKTSDDKVTVFVATDSNEIIQEIEKLDSVHAVFELHPAKDVINQVQNNTLQLLEFCKRVIKEKDTGPKKLIVYVPYGGTTFPYRSLMGLLRSVALESPFFKTKLLFDAALDTRSVDLIKDHLENEIVFETTASEVLYRHDLSRLVLTQKEVDTNDMGEGPKIKKEGIYLITGGLGSLGRIFAEFIGADFGARVILTGRSSITPEKQVALEALSSKNVQAHYLSCDISSESATKQMIDEVVDRFGAINGIIHSAGTIQDNYCIKKTASEALNVLSPKIASLIHLDRATKDLELDFFVSFSSVASFGNAGQADYATGNAFMDIFAHHRADMVKKGSRSGKSMAINWPLWKEGGMSPEELYEDTLFKTRGMLAMESNIGVQAFVEALRFKGHQYGIITGNAEKIQKSLNIKVGKKDRYESTPSLEGSIDKVSIQNGILNDISKIIGIDHSEIDTTTELIEYGFDSLTLAQLAGVINATYTCDFTGSTFFELSTVALIAEHLYENAQHSLPQVRASGKTSPVANLMKQKKHEEQHRDKEQGPKDENRLAIISYGGKFPDADDLDAFWQNIIDRTSSIKEVEQDRWKERGIVCNGAHKSMKHVGLMEDIDRFDAPFWEIDPKIAQQMDPQLRLLLPIIWHAIEQAGYAIGKFAEQKVGVFIAADSRDYEVILKSNGEVPDLEAGLSIGMLANMVSYYCNFKGPSESIDNACSSVYVALNQAQRALYSGACDVAIVAGVKLLLDPSGFMIREQLLSKSGAMYSFDEKADGYIRGEGAGCLVLKPLKRAEKDKDTIHAIVAGTGISHNGNKGLSFLAPNVEAQCDAIHEAFQMANINPATVQYIEAHGTATDFNDAAEIAAYKRFFKAAMSDEAYENHRLAIGSVKPNIGHLEAASGIASLLKAILALKHRQIPPVAGFSAPHPSLFLENSPFYIPTAPSHWKANEDAAEKGSHSRRVSLHAVGIGGVNAHVLLEESRSPEQNRDEASTPDKESYRLFVISAKSRKALQQYNKDWLDFIKTMEGIEEDETALLANMAYSSQVAREPMRHRQAIVVKDIPALKACLQKAIQHSGKWSTTSAYLTEGIGDKIQNGMPVSAKDKDSTIGYLSRIAEHWVKGHLLYDELLPHDDTYLKRIPIPGYPFENKRHWFRAMESKESEGDTFERLFYDAFGQ